MKDFSHPFSFYFNLPKMMNEILVLSTLMSILTLIKDFVPTNPCQKITVVLLLSIFKLQLLLDLLKYEA